MGDCMECIAASALKGMCYLTSINSLVSKVSIKTKKPASKNSGKH